MMYSITNISNGKNEVVSAEELEGIAGDILFSYGQFDYIHKNIVDIMDTVSSEYKVFPHKKLKGFYSYSGFEAPEFIGSTLADILNNVTVNYNMLTDSVDVTDQFTADLLEEAEALGINSDDNLTDGQAEDIAGFLFDHGLWINPTYEELAEFNRSKCLDEADYIAEIFESEAV